MRIGEFLVGIKEPEGSENWPVANKNPNKNPPPCWWTKFGHTDPSFGTRPVSATDKYKDNYDDIDWDKGE